MPDTQPTPKPKHNRAPLSSLPIVFGVFLLSSCCSKQPPPSVALPAKEPVEVIAPAITPIDQYALTDLEAYIKQEGPEKRGDAFGKFVLRLDTIRRGEERRIDCFTLFLLLGPPDYQISYGDHSLLVYMFDRFGKKDWSVFIYLDSSNYVTKIGNNGTEVNDLRGLAKYPAVNKALPPTRGAESRP